MRNHAVHALFLAANLFLLSAATTSAQVPTSVDNVQITLANPRVARLLQVNGDTIAAASITLVDLITYAYGASPNHIQGLSREQRSTRFDVVGTIDVLEKPDPKHLQLKLNPQQALVDALLKNHFRMAIRLPLEPQVFEDLYVGYGGPRLGPSQPGCTSPDSTIVSNSHLTSKCISMQDLARLLATDLHINIEDKTNLQGTYAIDLDWASKPPNGPFGPPRGLLTKALQEQLGLSLTPSSTHGVDIVIDYIEFPASMAGVPPKPDSAQTTLSSPHR